MAARLITNTPRGFVRSHLYCFTNKSCVTTKSSYFEWSLKGGPTVVNKSNNKHLMTSSKRTGNFLSRESQCFPRRSPGNFETGNLINLAVTAVVDQHSRDTLHCYPLT